MKERRPSQESFVQNAKVCLANLIPDLSAMKKERRDQIGREQEAEDLASKLRRAFESGELSQTQIEEIGNKVYKEDPYKGFLVNWNFNYPKAKR